MDRPDLEEDDVAARRLFCPALSEAGSFSLPEAAVQHARVLRLGVGDEVELFDGRGRRLAARIDKISKASLACSALGPLLFTPEGPSVVLVQCLPKGKKLDDIVRMTTELGVSAIHLAVSERCVVQKSTRDDHKLERLLRIASEAARQSEQAYVPEITEPCGLAEVLAKTPAEAQRLALTERSDEPTLIAPEQAPLWLVVGPEGGLSPRDREILTNARYSSLSLGRAILRTETAAVVGVGLGISALRRGR